MIRFKHILILLFVFVISCKSNKEVITDKESVEVLPKEILRINLSQKVRSIFPNKTQNEDENTISQQIFEGLFKYNPKTLALENCLIENYTVE